MEPALTYAKEQKKNAFIALSVALALLLAAVIFTYLFNTGVITNVSFLFVIGLITIMGLFLLTSALFYGKYKSMKLIMKDPLVHWKYDERDEWLNGKSGETIISDHGIFYSLVNDKLHTFWSISSKLEALNIGTLPDYDYMTMNFYFIRAITHEGNTISASLRVPVPKGEEEKAEKLVEQLNQNLKLNKMKRTKKLALIVIGFFLVLILLVILFRAFN